MYARQFAKYSIAVVATVALIHLYAQASYALALVQEALEPLQEIPEFPLLLSTILAVVAPVIIQFINGQISNELIRLITGLVLSGVTAVAATVLAGIDFPTNPGEAVFFLTVFYAFTQIAFDKFWKPILFKYKKGIFAAIFNHEV